MDLFDALARWQRTLEVSGRCNANTRRQYRNVVFAWCATITTDVDWKGVRDPLLASEDDVVLYVKDVNPKGGYRNMVLRGLGSFYGWCADREILLPNPCRHLRPKDRKYGPAPSLTKAETRRVLAAAEHVDPRARWAIQLQYATGCRVGSLIAVEPRDLEWSPPFVHFRVVKNDDPYGSPLNEDGVQAALKLLGLIDYTPPTVATRLPTLLGVKYGAYRRWLLDAGERANVDVWTHLIRHTTITRMCEDPTVDFRTVMVQANWHDPTLVDRYAQASNERRRAAVESPTLSIG